MLTWDNFEFVQSDEELPWFPVNSHLGEEDEEEILRRLSKAYFNLLVYMSSQAVRTNTHYVPQNTVEVKEVWDSPCEKNNLPLCVFKLYPDNDLSFRAETGVRIKVKTKFESEEDGWVQHPHGYWYRVVDGVVEASFYGLISSETDQSKLGKV